MRKANVLEFVSLEGVIQAPGGAEEDPSGGFAYRRRSTILCISLLLSLNSSAQQKPSPLSPYVKEDAPVLVLEHVRLIDGTGSAPKEDMRIDIAGGKITDVQAASAHSPYPANAKVLDMKGKTVIPGLVGMHEHLFYPTPQQPQGGVAFYGEAPDCAPRLYLAGGVTRARTAGSVAPYTDLELKRKIDAGLLPGPKLDVTGPYLEGKGSFAVQMHASLPRSWMIPSQPSSQIRLNNGPWGTMNPTARSVFYTGAAEKWLREARESHLQRERRGGQP
jgi:hypothetical protein